MGHGKFSRPGRGTGGILGSKGGSRKNLEPQGVGEILGLRVGHDRVATGNFGHFLVTCLTKLASSGFFFLCSHIANLTSAITQ